MSDSKTEQTQQSQSKPSKTIKEKPFSGNILELFKPYTGWIFGLLLTSLLANGMVLFVPKLTANIIDYYNQNQSVSQNLIWTLGLIILAIFIVSIIQAALSSYISELIAKNLRTDLVDSISRQNYEFIAEKTSAKLITNLTSDVNEVKTLVSQGLVTGLAAILTLVGSSIFLVSINLKLGLMALSIIPLVAITFGLIFVRIGKLFKLSQENLDKINQVITESILAASLIRVLNSRQSEIKKFETTNQNSRQIGLKIISMFAALIPVINLLSNGAILIILWFGGQQVASGELSLGNFTAFFSYLSLLIFPIFLLGFIGSSFSRSLISLGRIQEITKTKAPKYTGNIVKNIEGEIEFKNVSLDIKGRSILKNVSFKILPNSKTAIIGPTAAGKTQIFSILAGLNRNFEGQVLIDQTHLTDFDKNNFYSQVGLVFQESIIFNTTLRENIDFKQKNLDSVNSSNQDSHLEINSNSNSNPNSVSDLDYKHLQKSIKTASLDDLVDTLPKGLETIISERGENLSGGQKQRIMLARALSLDPKVLLLDDFTARVDISTERKILKKLDQNYPGITLVSITQKIEPIKDFDQILLLMEGELLVSGTHKELLETSLEYQQIWQSQQSTE